MASWVFRMWKGLPGVFVEFGIILILKPEENTLSTSSTVQGFAKGPLFGILIVTKILTFHVQEALNIHEDICYLRSQQIPGIGEYKNLSPSSANRNFHAATPPFPLRHQQDSSVAIKPHHSAEDVNKPDMLLLKLALNFRATIISFSIFTNVI